MDYKGPYETEIFIEDVRFNLMQIVGIHAEVTATHGDHITFGKTLGSLEAFIIDSKIGAGKQGLAICINRPAPDQEEIFWINVSRYGVSSRVNLLNTEHDFWPFPDDARTSTIMLYPFIDGETLSRFWKAARKYATRTIMIPGICTFVPAHYLFKIVVDEKDDIWTVKRVVDGLAFLSRR